MVLRIDSKVKRIIQTLNAPEAIGTYSQGVSANNIIFTSGQIAIDPLTGKLINDNFKLEVKQVLDNLDSILCAGGGSLERTIKLNVYIINIEKFEEVNAIFNEYFNIDPPARSVVEVAALPMNARIKIDAIGLVK